MNIYNQKFCKSILFLGLAGLSNFAMAGGFSGSCSGLYINGGWLGANCGDGHGGSRWTGIDLNRFLGNIHGNFSWNSGGFTGSARNCGLSQDGILWCQLGDGHGGWPERYINLNDRITNSWGNMVYDR